MTAGTRTLVIVVPTTWSVAVCEIDPDVAVTVITRLPRSEPVEIFPVIVPSVSVFVPLTVTTALPSALMVTGTPAIALREPSIAVTKTSAVALPVLASWAVLKVTMRSAAAAPDPPDPVPNGGVPACSSPPPQEAVRAMAAVAVQIFSNLFMRVGSLAFCNGQALSALQCGR